MRRSSRLKNSASLRPNALVLTPLGDSCGVRQRHPRGRRTPLSRPIASTNRANDSTSGMPWSERWSNAIKSAVRLSVQTVAVARRRRFFRSIMSSVGRAAAGTRSTTFAYFALRTTDCWPSKNLGLGSSRSALTIGAGRRSLPSRPVHSLPSKVDDLLGYRRDVIETVIGTTAIEASMLTSRWRGSVPYQA